MNKQVNASASAAQNENQNENQNEIKVSQKDFEQIANEQRQKSKYKDNSRLSANEFEFICKERGLKTCSDLEFLVFEFAKKEIENNFDFVCDLYFKHNRNAKRNLLKLIKDGAKTIESYFQRQVIEATKKRFLNKTFITTGNITELRKSVSDIRKDCECFIKEQKKDKRSKEYQRMLRIKAMEDKIKSIQNLLADFEGDETTTLALQNQIKHYQERIKAL